MVGILDVVSLAAKLSYVSIVAVFFVNLLVTCDPQHFFGGHGEHAKTCLQRGNALCRSYSWVVIRRFQSKATCFLDLFLRLDWVFTWIQKKTTRGYSKLADCRNYWYVMKERSWITMFLYGFSPAPHTSTTVDQDVQLCFFFQLTSFALPFGYFNIVVEHLCFQVMEKHNVFNRYIYI